MARLNRALDDERTLFWLRAHVHAELALARWDAIYLLRQADHHPEELEQLVELFGGQVSERHRVLAELSRRIAHYLGVGGSLSTWADRLRIIRRAKLRSLLTELDELLRVFPRITELDGHADPIPLGDGSAERKQWDRLVSGARSLPQAAVPVLKTIGDRLPRLPIRRAEPDEDDQ